VTLLRVKLQRSFRGLGQRMFMFSEEVRQRNYENFVYNIMVKLNLPLTRYVKNIYTYIYIYTGCHRRNVPDFGRVFLM
jgi:hypothetical protein